VPLVEIVSGPDIRNPQQARDYVAELRSILVAIGASDGRMEEGSLRVDANVSVHKPDTPFGTRCEIKNLNSLRSLTRAIEYEALRQIDVLEDGGSIRQETRHWDEDRGETSTLRVKEEAEDYRYFREPDLVDLAPDQAWKDRVLAGLPKLPARRRQDLEALMTNPTDAQRDGVTTVVDLSLDIYVEGVAQTHGDVALAVARAANELAAAIEKLANLSVENFVATVAMEQSGQLSATQAKTVLSELLDQGGDPVSVAKAKGFEQLSTDSLSATVGELIVANPDEWQRFKDGDDKLAQFFIGLVMKATKGQANGKAVIAELQSRR
jgi:aspartyl-tRNA(Asn)/glutamyl-tRNA(Gln) amidotransferase subunit B